MTETKMTKWDESLESKKQMADCDEFSDWLAGDIEWPAGDIETNSELEKMVTDIKVYSAGMEMIREYKDGFGRTHTEIAGTFLNEEEKANFDSGKSFLLDPNADF